MRSRSRIIKKRFRLFLDEQMAFGGIKLDDEEVFFKASGNGDQPVDQQFDKPDG